MLSIFKELGFYLTLKDALKLEENTVNGKRIKKLKEKIRDLMISKPIFLAFWIIFLVFQEALYRIEFLSYLFFIVYMGVFISFLREVEKLKKIEEFGEENGEKNEN